MLPMNRASTTDPRAWNAQTAGDRRDWICPLPNGLIDALLKRIPPDLASNAITKLWLTDDERRAWEPLFEKARDEVFNGRGFVILDRLPVDRLSTREATALYWLIGQFFGEPFAQNVQGTLLYDVRDTGQDLASGARFSVTSYESSFHTDNSFGDSVLDTVGLLCLQPAQAGGISQQVSGYAVCEALRRENPNILETLCREFLVDRRGGVRDGEAPIAARPIVSRDGPELLVRYLRYWIEAGHEKAGQPLTDSQRAALDAFDSVLERPELRVEFSLEPGQMYFINNRWILHNRTAFTDDPERRRHLVRLWLQCPSDQ